MNATTQLQQELFHLIEVAHDDAIDQTHIADPLPEVKPLNRKAMTVQLKTSRPTTRFNDEEAAKAAQDALGDQGIAASTTLFKDKTNPIRHLLAEVGAVYQFHKHNTIPYIDRGPRLLPVGQYETYRDTMRRLIADVDRKAAELRPHYDLYVANDVDFRNAVATSMGKTGRASPTDYPTAAEFFASIGMEFSFAPLPDNSHWLFDVDEEDRRALNEHTNAVYRQALGNLRSRIQRPLDELVRTLQQEAGAKDPVTGKRMGIFRDTKVTNVADAVANVKALAMDDPEVIAACEMVEMAVAPLVNNPDVVRESPVVREMAAQKLKQVADKMGAFFGQ